MPHLNFCIQCCKFDSESDSSLVHCPDKAKAEMWGVSSVTTAYSLACDNFKMVSEALNADDVEI